MKLATLASILCVAIPAGAGATTITYNDFSSTAGLQLNNNAAAATDDSARAVLRVTPASAFQVGSAFSTTAITLADNYSFSTRFTFNINHQGGIEGADGLAFVVQTNSNTTGGTGGGIGYQGIANSLGIEFDTFNNGGFDDNSGNHIGIDLDGNIDSVTQIESPFFLDSANDLTAWVDYNSTTQLLEVRINNVDTRPALANLSYSLDLASILGPGNDAFVGFTSGTGSGWANHDVINWEFRDAFAPVTGGVPEPASWAMMIAGFGLVGGAMRRRRVGLVTV